MYYADFLDDLLTLERINEGFRQRTKSQASLPGEDAVYLLLYGLLRSGQIMLRRMDSTIWRSLTLKRKLHDSS